VGLAGITWWNHRGRLKDQDLIISQQAGAIAAELRTFEPARPVAFDRSAWDLQWAFRTHQPVIDDPSRAPRPCWFMTRVPLSDQPFRGTGSVNWGDTPGQILIYKLD